MNTKLRTILIFAAAAFFTGCEARIQQGLDERQANEIVTSLLERGFQPKKELEGGKKPTWSIVVDSDAADDATRTLVELGLPREKQPTAADLIKPGIVPSPNEEFQLKMIGLQGDIARTLEAVDGVITARVHLVVSAPPRPGQPQVTSKAAAFVRVRAGKSQWMEQNKDQIRQLIAASVEGLSVESVTLVVNEVQSSVPVQARSDAGMQRRFRISLMLMGVLLFASATALVFLILRGRISALRSRPGPSKPSPAQPAAPRKAA